MSSSVAAEAAQVLGDRPHEREIAALAHAERPGDGGCHQSRIGDRREVDERRRRPRSEARDPPPPEWPGASCRSAWSRQRQQPDAGVEQHVLDARELRGSPDERRALRRQVVVAALRCTCDGPRPRVVRLAAGRRPASSARPRLRRPSAAPPAGFSSIAEEQPLEQRRHVRQPAAAGLGTASEVMA